MKWTACAACSKGTLLQFQKKMSKFTGLLDSSVSVGGSNKPHVPLKHLAVLQSREKEFQLLISKLNSSHQLSW